MNTRDIFVVAVAIAVAAVFLYYDCLFFFLFRVLMTAVGWLVIYLSVLWFFDRWKQYKNSRHPSKQAEETKLSEEQKELKRNAKSAENANKQIEKQYQSYESCEEAVTVLTVKNTTRLPFSTVIPGELEIALVNKDSNKREILCTISLKSITCHEKLRLPPITNLDRKLECVLKYKSLLFEKSSYTTTFDTIIGTSVIHLLCKNVVMLFLPSWIANLSITIEAKEATLHRSPWLCEEENAFMTMRKKFVSNSINKLRGFSHIELNEVPNIAIIGSGGGMRAVIGMGGVMDQLKEEHILDCAMHVSGVSGSAWYLLTLYAYDSIKPKEVNHYIRQKLGSFYGVIIWMAWYLWKYYTHGITFTQRKFFSFTNIFGEMLGHLLLKKGKQKWSEQTNKLTAGNNPLPLVAALHGRHDKDLKDHDWIEFSPYQVYIPTYGIAVQMTEFGDEFELGVHTNKNEEPPIHFLQGICGSAYATFRRYRLPGYTWYKYWRPIRTFSMDLLKKFESQVIGRVPNFLRGRKVRHLTSEGFHGMYSTTDKDADYFSEQGIMLCDAGLACNSPYPLVLHPSREVDIIISFDFSDRGADKNWPFKHLVNAERWAKQRNVSFPPIVEKLKRLKLLKESNNVTYEEVYVFDSPHSPTIVHFVLINKSYKNVEPEDAARDFKILPDYSTFSFYHSHEAFDRLNALLRHNVKANMNIIIKCIWQKIVQKRIQNKRKYEQENTHTQKKK